MERMANLHMSEVDAAIEASKDHWTQVEPDYLTAATSSLSASLPVGDGDASETESGTQGALLPAMASRELYEEDLAFLRRLHSEEPCGGFGCFFQDSTQLEMVLREKIAEGGQAAIYEIRGYKFAHEAEKPYTKHVMKVFKAGWSLADLREQWPLALLCEQCYGPDYGEDFEDDGEDSQDYDFCCNPICDGCLLRDGRFGFVMFRMWGDLRKLMDLMMQHNGNLHPPFMMADGNYNDHCMIKIMLDIAFGMRSLHKRGTLHRDLKASNILIRF